MVTGNSCVYDLAAQCKCCKRVLVVENNAALAADYKKLLQKWGYEPYLATGAFEQLQADAIRQAHVQRCHVALVDMRLFDDEDKADRSGLEIIEQLRPTRAIVITAFGDGRVARTVLKETTAFTYVEKDEGPEKIREALVAAFRDSCPNAMKVQWPYRHEPLDIVHCLALQPTNLTVDQPRIAVNRLYAPAGAIEETAQPIAELSLALLGDWYRSPITADATTRSVVLLAQPKGQDGLWHQGEILKISLRKQIEKEISAYQHYVKPLLNHFHTARVEDTELLWDIGAIRYTNVSTSNRRMLQEWYEAPHTKITWLEQTITDLFQSALKPFFQKTGPASGQNLFEVYLKIFPKLQRLVDWPDRQKRLALPGLNFRVRNPVDWVLRHKDQSHFITHWDLLTHGDLHSNNVFVSENGETCLIDYEHTGPSHILRDFVELEADLLLRLLPLGQHQRDLALQVGSCLLMPETSDQLPAAQNFPHRDAATQQVLEKALKTITCLRKNMHELIGEKRMDEYYWALLMESLLAVVRDYSDWADPDEAERAKDWATLWCAMICTRLSSWPKAWPPAEWESR